MFGSKKVPLPSFNTATASSRVMALAVLALFAHRVERIGDRHYSCGDRYLVSAQPVGITATVPSFVVMAHDRHHWIREPDPLKYFGSDNRVNLHPVEFGRRERAGLVENVVGHGELSYVVQ